MSIVIYTGKPGHGKTIALMREFVKVCKKNEKIFNETGFRRRVKTSILPSPSLYARYAFYIEIFNDLDWLPYERDCDIFIDEMGSYFDSRQWASLAPEVIHALRLHRHRGIDIYGATQEFSQVDLTIRRLTTRLYRSKKWWSTKEPVKGQKQSFALMIATVGTVKPEHREIDTEFQETEQNHLCIYDKDDFNLYDTHQEVSMVPLSPLYVRQREVVKIDVKGEEVSRELKWSMVKP